MKRSGSASLITPRGYRHPGFPLGHHWYSVALFLLGSGEIPNYFTDLMWHHPNLESGRKSTPLLLSGNGSPGFPCGLTAGKGGMAPLFMEGMEVAAAVIPHHQPYYSQTRVTRLLLPLLLGVRVGQWFFLRCSVKIKLL